MSLQDINNNYASDVENSEQNQETQEDQENININENNGLIDDELSSIDFENIGMVPCEICETMINFNDYSNHLSSCVRNYNLRRERFNILNGFLNVLNASENVMRGPNINNNLIPRDDEIINDRDDIVEYNEENEINDENMGNDNNDEVNNIEVNSEEDDVVNDDNTVNDNNEELVEPYDQFIRNLTPLNTLPNTSRLINTPLMVPNTNNIFWSNNIGRRLINDIEINIGNLHNLTYENNNTEYDFNLLIQQLMGGDVKIGVKDFNKIIIPLKHEDLNDNDICNICLDNLKEILNNQEKNAVKINLPVKTTCNHLYCRNCIFEWLSNNKTCPVCKHEFEHTEHTEHTEHNDDVVYETEEDYDQDDQDEDDVSIPDLVSDTESNSDYEIQIY